MLPQNFSRSAVKAPAPARCEHSTAAFLRANVPGDGEGHRFDFQDLGLVGFTELFKLTAAVRAGGLGGFDPIGFSREVLR